MSDRLRGLAGVLIGYSAGVGPGELVLLEGPVTVEPLPQVAGTSYGGGW